MTVSNHKEVVVVAAAYIVTLGLIAFASSAPLQMLWGYSALSFVKSGWLMAAVVGVIWLPTAWWLSGRLVRGDGGNRSDRQRWIWPAVGGYVGLAAVLFVAFRVQAHFLGDGYEMLSTFASEHPIVKTRALGEATLHLWARDLFGGANQDASMMSFRVLSIGAGVLYLGAAAYAAWKLFAHGIQRLLFVLGMGTPGYLLLFFGYVELYSVFVAAIALFAMVGLLVAKGHVSRWWVAAAMAPPIVLHVMGVVVLPAAMYLLLAGTPVGDRVRALSSVTKAAVGAVVVLVGGTLFWYLLDRSYFFRLAVLPLVADRFTLDGYTLFAGKHLRDIANLLLVLAPGVLVSAAAMVVMQRRQAGAGRDMVFLIVLTISQWGAVFLFDPKLGMPRDWDLFAFAGVSVAALGTYWLVCRAVESRVATAAILLVVGLNGIVLGGRVAVQAEPSAAVEQFRQHMEWDLKRHQTSWTILVSYYQQQGDSTRAQEEYAHWLGVFPDYNRNRQGLGLLAEGRYAEALQIFRELMRENPSFAPAYGNIGSAYFRLNQLDSAEAYLAIARGMNPYNPVVLASYGQLLWSRNDAEGAATAWRQSLAVDSMQAQAAMGLAAYYRQQRDRDNYFRYMAVAAAGGNAPASVLVELGEYYLSAGQAEKGREFLRRAVAAGLDSSAVEQLRRRHTGLAF